MSDVPHHVDSISIRGADEELLPFQAISPEVLRTAYGQALRSAKQILKVAFGRPGELWAIFKKNDSATQILQVRSQVSKILDLQKRERMTVKDIAFVALGCSRENFAIKVAGEVSIGGQEEMSPEERRRYDRLVVSFGSQASFDFSPR